MEAFFNSDSMPLSSHIQLTCYLFHAHALHLYKCETGQNIHVSSTALKQTVHFIADQLARWTQSRCQEAHLHSLQP